MSFPVTPRDLDALYRDTVLLRPLYRGGGGATASCPNKHGDSSKQVKVHRLGELPDHHADVISRRLSYPGRAMFWKGKMISLVGGTTTIMSIGWLSNSVPLTLAVTLRTRGVKAIARFGLCSCHVTGGAS